MALSDGGSGMRWNDAFVGTIDPLRESSPARPYSEEHAIPDATKADEWPASSSGVGRVGGRLMTCAPLDAPSRARSPEGSVTRSVRIQSRVRPARSSSAFGGGERLEGVQQWRRSLIVIARH